MKSSPTPTATITETGSMQENSKERREEQGAEGGSEHNLGSAERADGHGAHGTEAQRPDGIEAVRQKTIQVLSERIRLLGIARSGAYEHYNLQLANGFPIPLGEVAILDVVRNHLPDLRFYHEIGSGLGTLPLIFAHEGFASVGI